MPYLPNEIAQATTRVQESQTSVTSLQNEIAGLTTQRDNALASRATAQASLDQYAPEIAERDQKTTIITIASSEELGFNNAAAYHSAEAQAARDQVPPLQDQVTYLRGRAALIPPLQSDIDYYQGQWNGRNQYLQYLLQMDPYYHPGGPEGWQQDYWDTQNEMGTLQGEIDWRQNDLNALLNETAPIPWLEDQIYTLQNAITFHDTQYATATQSAAQRRATINLHQPRVNELNALLVNVPTWREEVRVANQTLDFVVPFIAAKQGSLHSAQGTLTYWQAILTRLTGYVSEIERAQVDRPALVQAAAELANELRTRQSMALAARRRQADATRRREVILAAKMQRASDKIAKDNAIAQVQGSIDTLNSQIAAKELEAGNAATAKGLKHDEIRGRPQPVRPQQGSNGEYNEAEVDAYWAWWDELEELKEEYRTLLNQELAARQEQIALEAERTAQEGVKAALQNESGALQAEMNALDGEYANQGVIADFAAAEASTLEAVIPEYRAAREGATARLMGNTPTNLPLLLFPVRVETRFMNDNGTPVLRVRIYPDDIHVDSHEPGLTTEEEEWGSHFWQATTTAATDAVRRAAWEQLALRFGPNRAAWIARYFAEGRSLPLRNGSWTRAPHTEVLPDYWAVVAYRGEEVELTAWTTMPVQELLPVGPSPVTGQSDPFLDPAIAWMTDFTRAVEAGMALQIPLSSAQAQSGFDRLLVVGVKGFLAGKDDWAEGDAAEAATRLTRLLDGHHYTRGLAFARQATPTNNTAERPSGYTPADPLDESNFDLERGAPLIADGDGSDGARTAAALGIPASVFEHVRDANAREQSDAQTANAAMWPAFQSHFLEAILSAPTAAASGVHFAENVRGRGPFPALRVGNQPYGVLPVTSLERWVTQAGQEESTLAPRLRARRAQWRLAGERAAHSGRGDAMIRLLQQQPAADRYRIAGFGGVNRNGVLPGSNVVAPFASRLAALNHLSAAERQALVIEALDAAAYRLDAWATSLATRRLRSRPAGATGLLLGAYGWVEGLRPAGPRSSHGFLQAPSIAQATAAAILRSGYLAHRNNGSGEALAVDLSSDRVRRARWLLDGVRAGQSLGALLGYRFERALQDNGLSEYIATFRTLAALIDDDDLAQAMAAERQSEVEYVEAQAYHVEVLAAFNAASIAEGAAQAVVEDLNAAVERQQTLRGELITAYNLIGTAWGAVQAKENEITALQANKPRPRVNRRDWETPPHPEGDIYLPPVMTLSQWQTALRNLRAEKAQKIAEHQSAIVNLDRLAGGPGQYEPRLTAIDNEITRLNGELAMAQGALTSATNTRASWQIELYGEDGNGGAAADAHAKLLARDAARAELRDLLETRWQTATESVAAHNVVDGFELHRRWKAGSSANPPAWNAATIPWGDALVGLPALDSTDQLALTAQLAALNELVDAVSDLLVAEGVYQLAQGNPVRAGTTLEAIASGKVAPPELEVIRTPRSGTALTHRLMALLPGTRPATPPWGAPESNPRAVAEPYLNQWLAGLLPHPATVSCGVSYLDPATSEALSSVEMTLDIPECSPLDFLTLPESSGTAQASELEQRLAYHALRLAPDGVPDDAVVRLDFGRADDWDASVLSVAEFLETLRAARTLVQDARALDGRDLDLPGEEIAPGLNLTDLQERANQSRTALQQAITALATITTATEPETARSALLHAAGFGVSGALPVHPRGDSPALRAALAEQAAAVALELGRRQARLLRHEQQTPGVDPLAVRDYHTGRIRIILGNAFPVLALFTPPPSAPQTFDPARQLAHPMVAVDWVQRLSQVRTGTRRFHDALTYAEALATGAAMTLRVGQLPYQPGEQWIALAAPDGGPFPSGRLSLVAHAPDGLSLGGPVAGLLLDEWVEVVPNATETTGVAFHYNQPNAQPPQALLVAVAPDISAGRTPAMWDLDTLTDTLRESATLARARAATPEALNGSLWHTARHNDGSWEPFTLLDEAANLPTPLQTVGIAVLPQGSGEVLHVVGATVAGELWYGARGADGVWGAFSRLETLVGDRGAVSELAVSAVGGTVHLCVVTPTGLWHSIRFTDGTWQAFGDVGGAAGRRGTAFRVACAGVGAELHVLQVTKEGKLWYALRHGDGSWTPFTDVEGQTGDVGFITNVCAAAVNADLHLCATSTSGFWHGVRWAGGTWTQFGDLRGQVGTRGYVESLACSGIGAEFHLRTLMADGSVWHTARLGNGAWVPYHEVTGIGNARRLACAAAGGRWHLLDLSAAAVPTLIHFDSNALDLNALPA